MAPKWWSCGQRTLAAASQMANPPSREQQLRVFFERKPKIILGTESASRKGKLLLYIVMSNDGPNIIFLSVQCIIELRIYH